MKRLLVAPILWTVALSAQTQLDLRTQSRRVDFSAASSTKPFQTGAGLPATCTSGEMFFKTNEPPGQNMYGCVAVNTWALQAGGGSGGGSGTGATTVQSGGTPVGTRSVLNFEAGTGIMTALSDNGQAVVIQHSLNTAVVKTQANDQSGAAVLCASTGGSTSAYACSLMPMLTMYTPGMVLQWKPDVSAGGGATTLNVDTLGARSVKLADGITDPSPIEIEGGRIQPVWYDGVQFRLIAPVTPSGGSGARPACNSETRGRLWFSSGSTGVQDQLSVCAKDAGGTYSWRTLY